MNSVDGETDPLQCRVRTLVLEHARLTQPPNAKRDSAGTTQSIAASVSRACAKGTLSVNFGMVVASLLD